MNPIFKKLNYKNQPELVVLNAPDSFRSAMAEMTNLATMVTNLNDIKTGTFMLAFVQSQKQLDGYISLLTNRLEDDGVLWFAYPKASSKPIVAISTATRAGPR